MRARQERDPGGGNHSGILRCHAGVSEPRADALGNPAARFARVFADDHLSLLVLATKIMPQRHSDDGGGRAIKGEVAGHAADAVCAEKFALISAHVQN